MKSLRSLLDRIAPNFEKGGRFERWFPLWEAADTFFYTPHAVTRSSAHVRDAMDLKRMMFLVVIAALPCIYMAMYNTCLLYTSDAADERSSVDLGGRRIIKKKKKRGAREKMDKSTRNHRRGEHYKKHTE